VDIHKNMTVTTTATSSSSSINQQSSHATIL